MKQTTIKIYQDMTTDEFIDLLQSLKGSKTGIEEIAVKRRDHYAGGYLIAVEHYFNIKTEDKQCKN